MGIEKCRCTGATATPVESTSLYKRTGCSPTNVYAPVPTPAAESVCTGWPLQLLCIEPQRNQRDEM